MSIHPLNRMGFLVLALVSAAHAQTQPEMLPMNALSSQPVRAVDGCPFLPAGSIAIGDYCGRIAVPELAGQVALYALDPSDGTLKAALERWSKATKRKLVWVVDSDLPITRRREYGSDLLMAMNVLMQEASVAVPMGYGVDQFTITVMPAAEVVAAPGAQVLRETK